MITSLLEAFATQVVQTAHLKVESEELKSGQIFSWEKKDDVYAESVINDLKKLKTHLLTSGVSALDISLALQLAEGDSADNEWFAGLFYQHSPSREEKIDYYANHTNRPAAFAQKIKKAIFELFDGQTTN